MADLFESINLAGKTLNNRIVMPPMTRSRASQPGDIPNNLMATYYAQRATAGLIISEGTQISQLGKGYAWTPGSIQTPKLLAGNKSQNKCMMQAALCLRSFGMLDEYRTKAIQVGFSQFQLQQFKLGV